MRRTKLSLLLAAAFLVAAYAVYRHPHVVRAQASQGSKVACCGPNAQVGPREIDFPYYSLRDGFNSTLLLVSDSPHSIDLNVAVRGLRGETVLAPMSIEPQEKLTIDVAKLLTKQGADITGAFAEGSIAVYFIGTIMPVVGQLTMTNPATHLIHESEMVENDPGRSDIPAILNGLWWNISPGRDARIMVSNTGGNAVTADVFLDFAGKRHPVAPLMFSPHETKVLSVTQMLGSLGAGPADAPQGGITIIQHEPHPSLIAQGKVLDPVTGFSTTLEFPDPARQPASALHAVGLPIGTPSKDSPYAGAGFFTPHVIARNLTGAPQTVTITIEYPKGSTWNSAEGPGGSAVPAASTSAVHPHDSGAPESLEVLKPPLQPQDLTGQVTLASLPVGPYATVDYSLDAAMSELPAPLPFCSIRIQYSGAPGSMIVQVSSVDHRQDLVVEARTMNEGDGWAGSGANPWRLDPQTQSFLFLTDESDKPARIGFLVTANGTHYYLTTLKLAPHETRMINLGKLRDAQQADFKQNNIPAGATEGSVNWIRIDSVSVTGRVVVISRHGGVASSYDCCACPCPASYTSCAITPPPPSCLGPHGLMQMCCMAEYQTCNGAASYVNETSDATWSSSNSAVASFDSSVMGLVHAHAAGSVTLAARYTGKTETYEMYHNRMICAPGSATLSDACPVNVTNSGCPDHLEVEDDYTELPSCDGTYHAVRHIIYDVVDGNDVPVGATSIRESFIGETQNTCGNATPSPSGCSPTSGTFPDVLSVGCNSIGGSCGFSLTQQWLWCPPGYQFVVLATLPNDVVHANQIVVLGYAQPGGSPIPIGTEVYP